MGDSDTIIKHFPGLTSDPHFKITSPVDKNYNCIAWAYALYKDRWMQFDTKPRLDGVWYWWPNGVAVNQSIDAYIEAFKTKGYEVCDSHELENNYVKIALYVENNSMNCTHASRQKTIGTWMSKLGSSYDIEHGTPYTIEGSTYGKVHCIMKVAR